MTFYAGPDLSDDVVSLRAPDLARLRHLAPAADVAYAFQHWLTAAQARADVHYFSVFTGGELAGQIVLHDLDLARGETLIAYHLIDPAQRGRGIGTRALRLLQAYLRTTGLRRAVIITSRDNLASQRIAEKCGFVYTGPSREDPDNGVVYVWHVPLA